MQSTNTTLSSKIAKIAKDQKLKELAAKYGLDIYQITWEDSARYKNSCNGPNISDMTLMLSNESIRLPVIRKSNFIDLTTDINIENFSMVVGNDNYDEHLKKIPLKDYLENKDNHLKANDGTIIKSLWIPKDEVILTTIQYCILPLTHGTCEFNVNIFNYQSSTQYPAVLAIVVSSKGTSAQCIYEGTTPLYFNYCGKAANFIAERLKDERKRLGKSIEGKMDMDEQERNVLFIYQIPLKCKNKKTQDDMYFDLNAEVQFMDDDLDGMVNDFMPEGMDDAVLGVGKTHSDFIGIQNGDIERDDRFPIRCTIQYYKVTDIADISEIDIKSIAEKIDNLSKYGNSGSLVVEDSTRKTEWTKSTLTSDYKKTQPDEEKQKPIFKYIQDKIR